MKRVIRIIRLPETYREAAAEKIVYEQALDGHFAELRAAIDAGGISGLADTSDDYEVPHLLGYSRDGTLVLLASLIHDALGGFAASISISSLDHRHIILVERDVTLDEFTEDCYQMACLNANDLRWISLEYTADGWLKDQVDWRELPPPDTVQTVKIDRIV